MKPHQFVWILLTMALIPSAYSQEPTATLKEVDKSAVAPGPFLVKPYLQLGSVARPNSLSLLWHSTDGIGHWQVEYLVGTSKTWRTAVLTRTKVALPGTELHWVHRAALIDLEPGEGFKYAISRASQGLFSANSTAPRRPDQAQRFVVFGDCGANTPQQRAIAYRTYLESPDYVMITGEVVCSRGLISEYRDKFWPIYNASEASESAGAPLLRSTLFVAAPGNHDIASRDLEKTPDGLAYFFYWDQPLNGPTGKEGGALVAPVTGPPAMKKAFLDATGPAFPRMANFSFDVGNVHWTILDANASVDWTNLVLQKWVADDLAAAKDAGWRFISFHQPGFNSSKKHFDEQYMRNLAPIFEGGKVDVVFNGHVHNYQRSYPMHFLPETVSPRDDGTARKTGRLGGKWTLDKTFNGQVDTSPDGVIYIVTGAGGQSLYNPEQQDQPETWQEFTFKHISKVHTLSVVDVAGATMTLRQITPTGEEVDRFVIKK